MRVGRSIIEFALLLAVVIFADFGFVSQADGVLLGFALALLAPHLAPYILLELASFQNVRGVSIVWWYVGSCFVGAIVLARSVYLGYWRRIDARAWQLILVGAMAVIYAGLASLMQISLAGHPQSAGRDPLIVTALMLWMPIAGTSVALCLGSDVHVKRRLLTTIGMLMANALVAAGLQLLVGPEVFSSPSGMDVIASSAQLVDSSSLGFARISGTYLTPNGFALFYILLLLSGLLIANKRKLSGTFIWTYFGIGSLLAILSLSKSIGLFVLCASLGFFLLERQKKSFLLVASFAAIALIWAMNSELISEAFRIPTGGLSGFSYRAEAWRLVAHTLTIEDWLFGTGLAYWPVLFRTHLGFSLSDPHTFLLSIPGTFGLIGVIFYVVLAVRLGLTLASNVSRPKKALALALIFLFFVKDLFSIPYALGNTPLTMLIWALIVGMLAKERFEAARSNSLRPMGTTLPL